MGHRTGDDEDEEWRDSSLLNYTTPLKDTSMEDTVSPVNAKKNLKF